MRPFIVIILFLFSINHSFSQTWRELRPGLEIANIDIPSKNTNTINATIVRISPARFTTKVVGVLNSISQEKQQYPIYSISELIPIYKPIVIINGGFSTSYSNPFPAGLVIENRKMISRLNKQSSSQTGIFCVTSKGVKIVTREEFNEKECIDALQAGPLLIEKEGKPAIYKNEPIIHQAYIRSIIAIDKQQRIHLLSTSTANLYELSKYLAKKESEGGLGCISALNLSGDVESGLYIEGGEKPITIGNINVSISSAIVFVKK